MGKHARKRQRKDGPKSESVVPLGTEVLLDDDDVNKDDEERRLESLLFGKPFVKERRSHVAAVDSPGEDEESVDVTAAELEGMLDSDLFFVDDGPSKGTHLSGNEIDVSPLEEHPDASTSGDEEQSEASPDSDGHEPEALRASSPSVPHLPKSRKAPAWTDPDDASLEVSLASSARLRKLRDAPDEDTIGGREYERRLRRQYVKMNPTPEWATAARRKRRRTEGDSDADADVLTTTPSLDTLVTSSGGILDRKVRTRLDPGVLAIERLRDANQAAQTEGEVTALQFHPSPQVSMLLVAGSDRRIRLFNVDGHTNPHLQTLHIPALPITNAQFHPSGSSILLTGHRPFYYTYDLQSGTTTRSPRGLWSTTFANGDKENVDLSMNVCAFNASGNLLAVAGRRGYVHLVDWRTGAGQVVGSVKANTGVRTLSWLPNGTELMTLGEDAEAYIWDIRTRRCMHRWKDDGGFGSRVLAGDRSGSYLAVGSKSGIVNVYGTGASSWRKSDRPKPLKAIGNLTTPISVVRFNHDSQLLAIASNIQKDKMRLVRLGRRRSERLYCRLTASSPDTLTISYCVLELAHVKHTTGTCHKR
ncbi:WD40-repeat-containing domain protein [Lactifluus volemus]|nr:WD40-repeat-containing domain protein [Lactifluus volemus]